MSRPPKIEWAVLEPVFRGTRVVRGGLGSREEAEAWIDALRITQRREDHEHFMATDGMTSRSEMYVGWRYVDPWHHVSEDPNQDQSHHANRGGS